MKPDKVWLQWKDFHGKAYPTLLYGELQDLPQSDKREAIGGMILLDDEDANLPLPEIVKKFPAPKKEGGSQ